jgi:hypothetical protein
MALSGGDIRVAAGLAASGLMIELIVMMWTKKLLSDDEALTIFTGAIDGLGQMAETQPHPTWAAAQNLLRIQAARFGGPVPGSKPS